MKNIDVTKIIAACETLSRRIVTVGGKYHGSAWIFDQCMRAFDNARIPAEAITFQVFINAPVMKNGEATIHRDGWLEMRTV